MKETADLVLEMYSTIAFIEINILFFQSMKEKFDTNLTNFWTNMS